MSNILIKFEINQRVRKLNGSEWEGVVCGFYSTPTISDGINVMSDMPGSYGSVQLCSARELEEAQPRAFHWDEKLVERLMNEQDAAKARIAELEAALLQCSDWLQADAEAYADIGEHGRAQRDQERARLARNAIDGAD